MTDTTKDSVTDALPEPDLLFFDDRLQSPMHGYTPTAVMQIIDTLRAENERLRTVLKATQEACDPQINADEMMQMAVDNTMLRLQLAEVQKDAYRGKWLIEHAFQYADVSLGSDLDGNHCVCIEPRFNIPEPSGLEYEDEEWSVSDLRAAIDAARGESHD